MHGRRGGSAVVSLPLRRAEGAIAPWSTLKGDGRWRRRVLQHWSVTMGGQDARNLIVALVGVRWTRLAVWPLSPYIDQSVVGEQRGHVWSLLEHASSARGSAHACLSVRMEELYVLWPELGHLFACTMPITRVGSKGGATGANPATLASTGKSGKPGAC